MLRASGLAGKLLAGGRQAALLGRWQLTPTDGGHRITAAPVIMDSFWMAHGAQYTLLLSIGVRVWRWDHVQVLEHNDRQITIQAVGRPEE